ncbi:MAG: hypothetical protein ABIJ92_01210 [Candidatus Aenigmatarchaeota archaeon]
MPNVCLIGYEKVDEDRLRALIAAMFADQPFVKGMVIPNGDDRSRVQVLNAAGNEELPFIRFYCSDLAEAAIILARLVEQTGQPIEFVPIPPDDSPVPGFTEGDDRAIVYKAKSQPIAIATASSDRSCQPDDG